MPVDPIELIKSGNLAAARQQLTADVKAAPADAAKRTLLFQVLAFYGEWDKAERHLDLLATQNSRAETGVQVYKNLIAAERERSEVVAGNRRPSFMTTMPTYLDQYFAAWENLKAGKIADATELYELVEEQIPPVTGTLNGKKFNGVKDLDTFLASFIEVFIHERYLWMPLSALREVTIEVPRTLLDLLWTPASITTWEGLTTSCYLPVLYPGSSLHDNDLVRLGKMTDWQDLGGGFYRGMGQHVLLFGDEEKAILEIREIQFNLAG